MELFKLLGTIAVDTSKADKAIEGTANKADKAGSKTSTAFEKIVGAAKKVGTGVLVAGATMGGALPIDTLRAYVHEAVRQEKETVGRILIEQMERLPDYLKASMPKGVVLDTGAMVGELTPAIDARLSDMLSNVQRGNVR